MDRYVTGAVIKRLREEQSMTQAELAEKLCVSPKAVSKWETGRGLPDISLLEPLACALSISTLELLSGEDIRNRNRSGSLLRSHFYVCPVCGNVLHSMGEAVISCCGITLPPLEAEEPDPEHLPELTQVEDEWFVTIPHEMTKSHYISFLAVLGDSGLQLVKLYPEGAAEARFKLRGMRRLFWYCNRHGLYSLRLSPSRK